MIMLNIEPTNLCNARCYYCIKGQSAEHAGRSDFLSVETHQMILAGLSEFLDDPLAAASVDRQVYLRYCGVGEPTLNAGFAAMLSQALEHPQVAILAVLSNGSGWSQSLTDSILDMAIRSPRVAFELVFSLDTLREQTQKKIKQLSNINAVNKQLGYLLEKMQESGCRNVHPVFQQVALTENRAETEEFVFYWSAALSKHGFSWKIVSDASYTRFFIHTDGFIWLKRRDCGSLELPYQTQLHQQAMDKFTGRPELDYAGKNSPVEKTPLLRHPVCGVLWYGVNVSATGDVTPCCIDIDYRLKLGNVQDRSLRELFRSPEMTALRKAHTQGNLSKYEICRCCSMPALCPAKESDIAEYERMILRAA
jgi:radical SAM protein with 4Fe4S-binding SPASM domain